MGIAPRFVGEGVGTASEGPSRRTAPANRSRPSPRVAVRKTRLRRDSRRGDFPPSRCSGATADAESPRRSSNVAKKSVATAELSRPWFILAAIGGGAAWYFLGEGAAPVKSTKGKTKKTSVAASTRNKQDADQGASEGRQVSPVGFRKPIELRMIPGGAYGLIHLRPADCEERWTFRRGAARAWGRSGSGLKSRSPRAVCSPADIEEALFCLVPSIKGEPPGVAVVVRTRNEMKRSTLQDKFNGEQVDEGGVSYFKGKDFAYFIRDSRTFAVCPASLATDMVASADEPSSFDPGIENCWPGRIVRGI